MAAHLLWEQGAAGSNPAAPTTKKLRAARVEALYVRALGITAQHRRAVSPQVQLGIDEPRPDGQEVLLAGEGRGRAWIGPVGGRS